ncbi:glycosyltransferase [Rhodococcus jostii]|uniref:Glycosyltransferase involved in cell wall bisynthesis n=1 Tax=Rhodococcus jostii TaxID=132919 RepID=A0A1H5HKV3_RHOJO|nr:glycosyltransferase [Rhodococcus jostii]SEE28425.1 Glycosyltransferase involved in cell wall bisynthesis [Rhodococcus jostii]
MTGTSLRICVAIPSLSGGGAEFVAREWAAWLARSGHSVSLAVTHPKDTDPKIPNVDVVHLTGSGLISHARSLRNLLRRENVDIVVSLLPYYNLMAILAARSSRTGVGVVISGRNVEVPYPEVHGTKVVTTRILSKFLYPFCDAFVAISHPVAAEAGALYRIDSSRIAVVPNPATAKIESDGPYEKTPGVYSEVHDSGEVRPINIILPGRLVDQKEPAVALRVAEILQRDGCDVTVHYFGDGPLRSQIMEDASFSGVDAVVHGWIEDWYRHVPQNSVVLLPSRAEGFGNVLVEAAAVGVPAVVSSQALGSADAVIPGLTGEFALSRSADSFAKAVRKASKIEIVGVEAWLKRFGRDSSGAALLAVLESVAGRRAV